MPAPCSIPGRLQTPSPLTSLQLPHCCYPGVDDSLSPVERPSGGTAMNPFTFIRWYPFVLYSIGALAIFAALCGLFLAVLHPWLMNWGSTRDEQTMGLPGDTEAASTYLTRAITVNAPRAAVWPWLMQIGQDRAGFYSNDYLENLTGANIHNADSIRSDWQVRAVGDKIRMTTPEQTAIGGASTLLTVRMLEPQRVYADVPGRFVLQPVGEQTTRLLLREKLAIPERSGAMVLIWAPM